MAIPLPPLVKTLVKPKGDRCSRTSCYARLGDIHTHYDAQATWDPYLNPQLLHGVTTTVMGNCGVGFAPVKADKKDWLIGLMEGVGEDIPGAALTEGIQWEWETFPEYLEALKKRNYVMDIGTQVPHGAVRAYVI